MIRIRLYDHPFAPVEPIVFEAESLGRWLLEHYGTAPAVMVQIFAGEPCAENEITGDVARIMASDQAEYVVLESPGAAIGAFIVANWIWFAVAAVFAVAAYLLVPKPAMPGNVNRTQQSPNNALGSRENKVRLLERVEDI